MMYKRLLILLPVLVTSFLFTACQRTSREVWEDTKTASRYMRRGLNSMFGRHADDYSFAYHEQGGSEPADYLPLLSEDDQYLSTSSDHLPPARESPGEPGSHLPGIEAFSTPTGALATLFKNIRFETDSYTVRGRDMLENLEAVADYLNKHQGVYVFIEGHADERGPAAYNLALGDKRANSIRTFLAERGVDPDRLFTITYGKERPLSFGHDELAWEVNRRAEFKTFEK